VRSLASDVIGSWTSGLLSFSADSLSDVAGAFERRTGAKIMVDTDLMGRPFTGSVRVSGSADRDVPHLAALIGVDARYDGTRWILSNPR
jgi:transmembrane sensor